MLKAAANLTRDLNQPNARIYWADMLGSAAVGYAALLTAMFFASGVFAVAAGIVAVLALYRAGSFIHELTHIKKGALKGFRTAWNMIVGVPLLVPSFMYEGVHNQHHAKTYYGTANDPEYLPLALMRPWTLPAVPGRRAARAGAAVRALCAARAIVAAVAEAAHAGRGALFGAADQPAIPPPGARGRVPARLAAARGGVQRVGDRAARADRDRSAAAALLPHLPRRRRRA